MIRRKEKKSLMRLVLVLIYICSLTFTYAQFNYKDILGDKKKITIPFEYEQGFIIMEVALNNALPLSFIFDTGAENTVLLEKFYAKLMGLQFEQEIKVIGADKSTLNTAFISRRVPLSFVTGQPFVTDLLILDEQTIDFNNIIGRTIDGILGGNILLGAVVEIDYFRQTLTFYDSATYKKPNNFHEERIEIINQRPFVNTSVAINGENKIDIKLLMDTGAGLHLLLDEESHPAIMMPDSVVDGRIGEGLGGNLGGYLGNVSEFDILDDDFRNVPVYFHKKDTSEFAKLIDRKRNGIVGNIYWQKHKVILDYSRNMLYTKPYRKKAKKFKFNKSGLIIFAAGHDFEDFIIKYVAEGSPADKAGLKSGDVLLKFNLWPSRFLNLGYINSKLSGEEGKKVKVKVLRKGEKIKTEFYLKSKKIQVH